MRPLVSLTLIALLTLGPTVALAETVSIPFGTTVFCELEETITTKQKRSEGVDEGDIVRAHVWRDVYVDGRVVIEAGTPVFTRVSEMKKARMAGRKGQLELEVLNVQAVDGRDVPLDGGYDKSGRGRMGLSIALAAVVAWPLIFLKGKHAWLEPGTIFDSIVRSPVEVEVEDRAAEVPTIKIAPPFVVTIPYDEMDPDSKLKELPLLIEIDGGRPTRASIVTVNDQEIPALPVTITGERSEGVYSASVDFKTLSEHFTKGMNRFDVKVGEETTEVLLEIEL